MDLTLLGQKKSSSGKTKDATANAWGNTATSEMRHPRDNYSAQPQRGESAGRHSLAPLTKLKRGQPHGAAAVRAAVASIAQQRQQRSGHHHHHHHKHHHHKHPHQTVRKATLPNVFREIEWTAVAVTPHPGAVDSRHRGGGSARRVQGGGKRNKKKK